MNHPPLWQKHYALYLIQQNAPQQGAFCLEYYFQSENSFT